MLISASWVPRAIQVAAALRVGEILADGPLAIGEIARRCSSDPEALARLLRVLAAQEIVEEINEHVFGPTVLSDHLHYIDHPGSGEESSSTWSGLLDAVQSGRPAWEVVHGSGFFERVARDPEQERNWNDWNTITARAWLPSIIEGLELEGHETLVDIGGGQGNFLAEILPRFPQCRGVLLDLPSVVAGANEVFTRRGIAERCQVVPADAFERVPSDADVYLFCRVLFNWDRARRLVLLRTCRAATRSDSRLLIVEMVMPERGDPARKLRVAFDLNLWVSWGGTIPTRAEWDALLHEAGFEIRRVSEPASPVSPWQVIEAVPT
jgi:ubiquinone/menaquinone biosynthesis C-methylase UbiE